MNLRKNMIDVFNVLRQDETLLRLLVYKAAHLDDDVLIPTPLRPNILSKTPSEIYEIVSDHIVKTVKTEGLDGQEKCRILMYPSRRRSTGNYYTADQTVVIDILTHNSYGEDFRLEAISDRLAELLFDQKITGLQKVNFIDADQINFNALPRGYVGFKLVFSFGSVK